MRTSVELGDEVGLTSKERVGRTRERRRPLKRRKTIFPSERQKTNKTETEENRQQETGRDSNHISISSSSSSNRRREDFSITFIVVYFNRRF